MNDAFEEDLGVYFDDENADCFGIDTYKDAGNEPEFAVPESVEPEAAEPESVDLASAKPSTSNNIGNDSSDTSFGGSLFYDGPEAEGFFLPTGSSYYYPTNFPVREYQKSIIETALFNNTLVVLPTGLGKTFIAAVVMYNFYRWYPRGLVIFMAPTRPLVTQQINACTDIMGIPLSDITEITGKTVKKTRIDNWKEKRIFFVTPHVMVNDITNNYCDPTRVRCIVVDEAHKAMGNYAYCQIVRQLKDYFLKFRIVALSATPGNNPAAYQEVIHNLNIAKIQVRAEDSPDVAKYIHGRKLSHIVLKLDNVWKQFQDKFLQVYEDYSRVLKDNSIVKGNISSLTSFQILTIMEMFKKKNDVNPDLKNRCSLSLLACSTLAHAHSLLYTYGFKALYSHFTGESDSCAIPIIRKNDKLRSLLRAIDDYLKDNGSPMNYVPSHPKFVKLREVVANHFTAVEQSESHTDTKVIIYCQFRVGVTEAHAALKELEPLIRPVMFIGQSSGKKGSLGLGQKAQLEILNNFKSGKFNTLIATSIGEEGLDIGEVDLIICLDAQSSITRHIQRIGRTGRKRAGACIFLVTEGKEEAKFKKCLSASSTFSKMINPRLLNTSVAGANPRMVPKHIKPKLHFVHIQPYKENKGKSKSTIPDDEEADEEAPLSKGASKRKKGKNEEKKEKQSKKAKIDKLPNGRTLFSYFTKKNFDSYNENDEETKDVFSTPKDKQLLKKKPKAPELDDIPEEDCVIIEGNNSENTASVLEANPGPSQVDFDHAQIEIPNDRLSTLANNSENGNEIEHIFSLFLKWVTNYVQNDDILIDENFVELVRLLMKKPSDYIPTSVCDIVNNSTRDSSPIDFGINFDSSSDDEVHDSPVFLPRKVLNSSPIKLENQTKNSSCKISSPVSSYSKVSAMPSPVSCNSKIIGNQICDDSPMMLPDRNKVVLTTSTPKAPQKRSFVCSSFNNRDHSNFLNQIPAQNSGRKIKNEVSEVSLFKPSFSEDSDSTSPLILTCKASKPVNPGTAKTLFPEDNVPRDDVPLTPQCNAEQNDEKCKDMNLEQFLSDSIDMFFENDEEDVQPSPKVVKNLISLQDEVLTQKENNAPNFNLDSKSRTVFSQEESTEKSSLFTTFHHEKSKWFETKKENTEKLGSKNWNSIRTINNKAAVLKNCLLSNSEAVLNKSNNVSISNKSGTENSTHKKSVIDSCKKHIAANAELAKTVEVVSSYFNDDSIFENFTLNTNEVKVSSNNKSENLSVDSDKVVQSSSLNNPKDEKAVQPISSSNQGAEKSVTSSKTDQTEALSQASSSESIFIPKNKPSSSSLLTKSITNTKKSSSSRANDLQSDSLSETECKNKNADFSSKFLQPPKREDSKSQFLNFNTKSSSSFDGKSEKKENTTQASKLEVNCSVEKSNCFKNPGDLVSAKSHNSSASSYQKSGGYSSFGRSTIQQSIIKNENKNSSFHSDSDESDLFLEQRPVRIKKSEERPRKTSKERSESKTVVANKKPKKKKSEFIEWEAEVSGSDVSEDEYEGDEDANHMPDSFIHDGQNTVLLHENTMTAQYLESIRSPEKAPGMFRIPVLPNQINEDVFSQTFHNDADYQNDSFCVDEEISEEYDGSEDELFDRDMKKAMEESKKLFQKEKISKKRKRIIESSSSNDEVILLDSPTEERKRCGDSKVVSLSSSSDEDNYTKKKPTRRKKSYSEKFSKFKKVIEARKFKSKPVAGLSKGESSKVLKPDLQRNGNKKSVMTVGEKDDSDTDFDDFLPRPVGSGVILKQRKGMETSVIGKKVKKVVKLNLFSSDED